MIQWIKTGVCVVVSIMIMIMGVIVFPHHMFQGLMAIVISLFGLAIAYDYAKGFMK